MWVTEVNDALECEENIKHIMSLAQYALLLTIQSSHVSNILNINHTTSCNEKVHGGASHRTITRMLDFMDCDANRLLAIKADSGQTHK